MKEMKSKLVLTHTLAFFVCLFFVFFYINPDLESILPCADTLFTSNEIHLQ